MSQAFDRSLSLAGFAEGVWHPEDLVRLEGTPWILVSAMRSIRGKGALLAVRTDAQSPAVELDWSSAAEAGRRSAKAFDPHGIDVRPLGEGYFELLVVDHGDGEAIDRLTIDASASDRPLIVAGLRIEKPVGTSGNAVAFLADGGFVMTSMFDPRDPSTLTKFARGEVTGFVWRWDEPQGWRRLGPQLSGANGIAVGEHGRTIFVSEWAARRVWKLNIDGDPLQRLDVDFLPDNLRWTDRGTLLIAGQAAAPEAVFGCEQRGEEPPLAYSVAELDPADMKLKPLVQATHEDAFAVGFGGATGALEVDDEVWVASFTGTRLARFFR